MMSVSPHPFSVYREDRPVVGRRVLKTHEVREKGEEYCVYIKCKFWTESVQVNDTVRNSRENKLRFIRRVRKIAKTDC